MWPRLHDKRNDPWWDLESYMNWEPGSWNDRKFTVAQGEGLFRPGLHQRTAAMGPVARPWMNCWT